jgi:hypothetical protein
MAVLYVNRRKRKLGFPFIEGHSRRLVGKNGGIDFGETLPTSFFRWLPSMVSINFNALPAYTLSVVGPER